MRVLPTRLCSVLFCGASLLAIVPYCSVNVSFCTVMFFGTSPPPSWRCLLPPCHTIPRFCPICILPWCSLFILFYCASLRPVPLNSPCFVPLSFFYLATKHPLLSCFALLPLKHLTLSQRNTHSRQDPGHLLLDCCLLDVPRHNIWSFATHDVDQKRSRDSKSCLVYICTLS